MRMTRLKQTIDERVRPPVTADDVNEVLGDVEIDCPSGEARCIQEVLDRDDVDEYATVDEVLESLMTNLDADYVGRKRYDDRGPNHDVDHVSF